MSSEQNNSKKTMDTTTKPELTDDEIEELLNETAEENYWTSVFAQLERMKKGQQKYTRIDIDKFNKKNDKEFNHDKLLLYKDSFKTSLYYYSNLSNYLRLAEMDNTEALEKYKYYQRRYREIQCYMETSEKIKHEKPTWDGYCQWDRKLVEKKWDKKRKENIKSFTLPNHI